MPKTQPDAPIAADDEHELEIVSLTQHRLFRCEMSGAPIDLEEVANVSLLHLWHLMDLARDSILDEEHPEQGCALVHAAMLYTSHIGLTLEAIRKQGRRNPTHGDSDTIRPKRFVRSV